MQTCVLGTQKNRHIETVLLSTHNICFGWEIRKIIFQYALFPGVWIFGVSSVNYLDIDKQFILPN